MAIRDFHRFFDSFDEELGSMGSDILDTSLAEVIAEIPNQYPVANERPSKEQHREPSKTFNEYQLKARLNRRAGGSV